MYGEIDSVLAARRLPTAADPPELTFTRMVFAESMRLYPPAWLIARVAAEAHDVRGYTIPRGAMVVLSSWIVHRSGTHFPEPERFDSDWWRPERQRTRPVLVFSVRWRAAGRMGEPFRGWKGSCPGRRRPALAFSNG